MKNIIFGLLASVVYAHADFHDEDPDSYLLTGRESGNIDIGLDTSYLTSGIPTKVQDYSLTEKFSDESEFNERGKIIVAKNEQTDEVIKIDILEKPNIENGAKVEELFS